MKPNYYIDENGQMQYISTEQPIDGGGEYGGGGYSGGNDDFMIPPTKDYPAPMESSPVTTEPIGPGTSATLPPEETPGKKNMLLIGLAVLAGYFLFIKK